MTTTDTKILLDLPEHVRSFRRE